MYYNLAIFLIIILLTNYFILRFTQFVDNPKDSFHKLEQRIGTPLSGGIYIFLSTLYLFVFFENQLLKLNLIVFLFLILIIGIFADIKNEFTPKLRIILQLVVIILFVFFNKEILINKTNIEFLDLIIENEIGKIIFTVFCIITLLNGFNFMDGVNGLASGYISCVLIVINLIAFDSANIQYSHNIIPIFLLFFFFNILGKSFLGDNGIYISSLLISYLLINFINSNDSVSPIIAVSLLWYPALENLFSILRRFSKKKLLYLPDKLHLHSLIYRQLDLNINFIPKKFKNTFTGLIIIFFLIPNFCLTYLYYDKSYYLGFIVLIYIFIYLTSYYLLKKKLNI